MQNLVNTTSIPATVETVETVAKPVRTRKPKAKPVTVETSEPTAAERAALITQQHADADAFFRQFQPDTASVAVKLFATFRKSYKADPGGARASAASGDKMRPAATSIAAFVATGKALRNGSKAPRRFMLNGTEYCIENGGLRRALGNGFIAYDPATETITIRDIDAIRSHLGKHFPKQA